MDYWKIYTTLAPRNHIRRKQKPPCGQGHHGQQENRTSMALLHIFDKAWYMKKRMELVVYEVKI